ncbi:bifunctional adenosylcobinamide kinase/adenosylcobinamide-phosphate guanylyltransferase, partial [Methylococcus sp. S1M]
MAGRLDESAGPVRFVLVYCLTLWLCNLLAEGEDVFGRVWEGLLRLLPALSCPGCVVSNVVGQGIGHVNPL